MWTDLDQDGLISREDMYTMLDMITDEPLNESVKKKVVDEVWKELVCIPVTWCILVVGGCRF